MAVPGHACFKPQESWCCHYFVILFVCYHIYGRSVISDLVYCIISSLYYTVVEMCFFCVYVKLAFE